MRVSLILFFAALCLCITSEISFAQSNLVLLVSQSGDYVGAGKTYDTTNISDFSVEFYGVVFNEGKGLRLSTVRVSAFGYEIFFEGPNQSNLTVGSYTNVSTWPLNENAPGLVVSGNSRGCNKICGNFQILELHTNGNGKIDHFWAKFTQYCECGTAPLTGEIRLNSQLATKAK
jgi:hypothetical protein